MNDRTEIIYIKKGIEKKFIINKISELFVELLLKSIFVIDNSIDDEKQIYYHIKPDIELIIIKNYKFNKRTTITEHYELYKRNTIGGLKHNAMLILDNCIFEEDKLEIFDFENIEIINPKFTKKKQC